MLVRYAGTVPEPDKAPSPLSCSVNLFPEYIGIPQLNAPDESEQSPLLTLLPKASISIHVYPSE